MLPNLSDSRRKPSTPSDASITQHRGLELSIVCRRKVHQNAPLLSFCLSASNCSCELITSVRFRHSDQLSHISPCDMPCNDLKLCPANASKLSRRNINARELLI